MKLHLLTLCALLALGCHSGSHRLGAMPYINGGGSTTGGNGCTATPFTVSYSDSMFQVASATATKTLGTLTSVRQLLCDPTTMDPQVAFTGSTITTGTMTATTTTTGTATATSTATATGTSAFGAGYPTCSLGSANNPTLYLPALYVGQTAQGVLTGGIFNSHYTASDSSLAVVLYCNTGGGNWGTGAATNLTAGKLWITVGTITLPAGS